MPEFPPRDESRGKPDQTGKTKLGWSSSTVVLAVVLTPICGVVGFFITFFGYMVLFQGPKRPGSEGLDALGPALCFGCPICGFLGFLLPFVLTPRSAVGSRKSGEPPTSSPK
jgi:hypothetical protein